MEIIKKKISELERAEYNPRVNLLISDPEYQHLQHSITEYGTVIPVIWNKRTNRVVGGHQRLTVLENLGETEADVSVVDLDETAEKQLNIALNKIEGSWDDEKVSALLEELGEDAQFTGFSENELEYYKNTIESNADIAAIEQELENYEPFFNITLTFNKADKDKLKDYIKQNGKEQLVAAILNEINGVYGAF